jgi:hypothetical protein
VEKKGRLSPAVLALLALFGLALIVPHLYPENPYQTLRFNGYMFNMFEANYQCTGSIDNREFSVKEARRRCSPFLILQRAQRLCNGRMRPFPLVVNQSMNGQPFLRIVDLPDACEVEATLFGKNSWIIPADQAAIVGYPAYNSVNSPPMSAKGMIRPEPVIRLSRLQLWIKDYLVYFQIFWFILWGGIQALGLNYLRRRYAGGG